MGQTDGYYDDDDETDYYLNFWYNPLTDEMVFQLRGQARWEPDETTCDMCGKDNGAVLRSDGAYRCSHCDMVWNG